MSHETSDFSAVAPGLVERDGIWFAPRQSDVSYPEEGNATLAAIEEKSFWYRHRNDCILAALANDPPRGEFFEIGGGNGYVAAAIQASGVSTALVEPDPRGVFHARRRGLRRLICASLDDAGILPGSLANIGLFDVVEHLRDDAAAVRKVESLLAPGGRLYLTVPAYNFLWSIEDTHDGHFRRYTLGRLRRLLTDAGLEIDYGTYFFSILPLPILALRTIPSLIRYRSPDSLARYHALRNSEAIGQDHADGGWLQRALLGRVFRWELGRIGRRRSIPFGGSCLVVARKRL